MSYPIIIFGAGASFDSIETHDGFSATKQREFREWKPPLTNDLLNRSRFNSIIDGYEGTRYFERDFYRINSDFSFEDLLTEIQEERAPNEPRWYERLMSLRLYLRHLFGEITDHYFDWTNNYSRLVAMLETKTGGRACLVNFNYDLLLEKSVFEEGKMHEMTDVNDYVSGKIKIIKMHGAYNWFRASGRGHSDDFDFSGGKKYLLENAQTILRIENGTGELNPRLPAPIIKNVPVNWDFYEPATFGDFEGIVRYFVPDIALPLHKKRDFVCPQEHIEILKREIGMADRILIIGWKAADKYLLDILENTLSGGNKPIMVVSPDSSEEVARRLKNNHQLRTVPINMGFSRFIKSGVCEKVLSAENMDILIQSGELAKQ